MIIKTYIFPVIVCALFFLAVSTVCPADLNQLYRTDYDVFWKQWREVQEKAMLCADHDATAKFLSNAIITLGNAEVGEANAESIEKLTLEEPRCFLESVQKLRPEEQTKIVKFFILRPLYHDEEELRKAMEKQWDKYRGIKELYYRLKNSS
jgi:hypothetical protein